MNNSNNLSFSDINYILPSQDQRENRESQNSSEEENRMSQAIVPAFSNIANGDHSTQKRKAPDSAQEGPASLKKRKISSKTEQIKDEINEISTLLDQWVNESSPNENRSEARERIINFLQLSNIEQKLDLKHLKLSELPDIFGYEVFVKKLIVLKLSKNKLAALPESIGNLINLTSILLVKNKLTTLPESIKNLTKLTNLFLVGNQLTALPESIGNLTKLTALNLSYNKLEALPESVENLINLTKLYLRHNQTLAGLPDTVLNLSENCTVELTNTGLSESTLQRLREASAVEGYQGPRFSYSVREHKQGDDKPLAEVLKEMYALLE